MLTSSIKGILGFSNVRILAFANVISRLFYHVGQLMPENPTIDISEMRENATQAAELLKAMSNENRLLILCYLGEQELSVTELNEYIDLSQSSLSQHLARLRNDGLVTTRRDKQTIYYKVSNPSVVKLIGFLQSEFCS